MTWSSSNKLILPALAGLACSAGVVTWAGTSPDTGAFRLQLPVRCDMARDCSIQKYIDRAPGPTRLDYRCGHITTDGHDGIDFRLRRARDMRLDVPVVAAAAGTVLRIRDDMPDISVRDHGAPVIGDRLAGNAVVVGHGGGWETQYSHLKRNSLAVRPGDKVAQGARIGAIGMSGNAEFPHLHFEVRRNGRTVDPFSANDLQGCNGMPASLWSAAAAAAMPYRQVQVLAAGFAGDQRTALTAHKSVVPPQGLADPDVLILWGTASSVSPQDTQKFIIATPKGLVVLDREIRVTKAALEWVGFAGLRRPAGGWSKGRYKGTYSLLRNGKTVDEANAQDFVMK
jgi:murein DD-endopeptidase MepM/ murein hydrolase activator NlpD